MTAQRTPSTMPALLLPLALLACGCGPPGGASGEGALVVSHTVTVTSERTAPYSETLPAAENLPARFEVDGQLAEIGKCDPQLVDPERGVELRLVVSRTTSQRSVRGDTTFVVHGAYGDYAVEPSSAYGLSGGERLRVDCGRNVPVGRVAAGR